MTTIRKWFLLIDTNNQGPAQLELYLGTFITGHRLGARCIDEFRNFRETVSEVIRNEIDNCLGVQEGVFQFYVKMISHPTRAVGNTKTLSTVSIAINELPSQEALMTMVRRAKNYSSIHPKLVIDDVRLEEVETNVTTRSILHPPYIEA